MAGCFFLDDFLRVGSREVFLYPKSPYLSLLLSLLASGTPKDSLVCLNVLPSSPTSGPSVVTLTHLHFVTGPGPCMEPTPPSLHGITSSSGQIVFIHHCGRAVSPSGLARSVLASCWFRTSGNDMLAISLLVNLPAPMGGS